MRTMLSCVRLSFAGCMCECIGHSIQVQPFVCSLSSLVWKRARARVENFRARKIATAFCSYGIFVPGEKKITTTMAHVTHTRAHILSTAYMRLPRSKILLPLLLALAAAAAACWMAVIVVAAT